MESVLSKIIVILLKRISVNPLLDNQLQSTYMRREDLEGIFLPYMSNYSDTELRHLLAGVEDMLLGYAEFDGNIHSGRRSINLFNAIFNFSDKMLVEQENEILCKYSNLLRWRSVTSQVSEETFIMAFMAKRDASYGTRGKCFSNKPVISHNNMQLKAILNNGMAENHFHLMGSAPYFQLSWIQLMNSLTNSTIVDRLHKFERKRRNVNIKYNEDYKEESFETRIRQAFLIRLYLFSRLTGMKLRLSAYQIPTKTLEFEFHKFAGIDRKEYAIDPGLLLEKWGEDRPAKYTENTEPAKHTILGILSKVWDEETRDDFQRKFPAVYDFMKYLCDEILDAPNWSDRQEPVNFVELLLYFVNNRENIELEKCRLFVAEDIYDFLWREKTLEYLKYLLGNSYSLNAVIPQLQEMVHSIKGANRFQPKDYAVLLSDYEWHHAHGRYMDLWGERNFLYQCFLEICKKGCLFSHYESNLFHAYLVIKENIRGEMVQANEYVGFENFQIHQDRKEYFSNGVEFEKSMARMAVRDTLQSQRITSLEARISPSDTARGNYEKIRFFDRAIDEKGELKNLFYYVFHFIKSQEKESDDLLGVKCRSYHKRVDIQKRAYALKRFREKYPLSASRVLGIDAASQEIGCRPEVFATVFRFLKSHTSSYGVTGEKTVLPQLRISYHVGEDFLDILDGLRAIEEAVLFLGMDCGDRLGHALALGIDVDEWYSSKKYRLSIPMQDYLDNIVWMYYAIIRYHVEDADNLKSYLESEFSNYFRKIYGGSINRVSLEKIAKSVKERYEAHELGDSIYARYKVEHVSFVFDIHAYYKAWQLRGDMPELYQKGYYDGNKQADFRMNTHMANSFWPEDFSIRYVPEVAYLYYLYHYSAEVKKEGRKELEYKVNPSIVKGVKAIQKELQKEIARRGIGIETNPSSNYMIGTFKKYAKHPIINFYNQGLVTDEEKLRECPQIWCSINTDDQGVFSSSLENEFALMAIALEKERDADGNFLYNKSMIYQWIDQIRINGQRQSFGLFRKENEEKKEERYSTKSP